MEPETNKIPELRFGKYHLIANLGHGGMADVFLAAAQGPAGFSKLQVIKRLRRSELGDEHDVVTMFLDEARLAARLNHPNVVQTNEVGEADGEYFIAMEYLDGQPLNRILHRLRQLPRGQEARHEAIALRIVADALAGLHYAHELADYDGTPLNVVHRDASPHNIFVTYDGHTKVVDFGIAKAATRSVNTSTGVLKGKISYMAPEQARCKPLDRRADIFVIGIVLWEILAGRKMWKGLEDMAIINNIFSHEIPTAAQARSGIPPELARIVDGALAYEVDDRYPTAADLRADLLGYLEQAGQRISTEEIGALVAHLFSDRRAHLQAVIDGQIKRLRTMGGAPLLDVNSYPPPSGRSGLTGSGSGSKSAQLPNLSFPSADGSGLTRQSQVAPPAPPQPQGRRLMYSALGGAVAAGVVALVVIKGSTPEAAPPPPSVTAVEAAPAQAAPPPAPAAAETPKTIELRVSASPASAKLFIDDAPLGSNPFTGRFPADGARHIVRVEAQGYATQKELATFNDDVSMEFDLEKKTAATVTYRPRRAASAPTSAPAAAPDVSSIAEEGLKPGATAKPKKTLSSDPWAGSGQGAAGDATGKPKRTLSSDPWAK